MFRPGMRVLDLGGGTGFQASLMARHGCEVLSIDLAGRPGEHEEHHPVVTYDGIHIPAADASFDAVFSSNVLEHVPAVESMLTELRRVLREDGFALHILPSASWRLWTSVMAFVHIVKQLARVKSVASGFAAGRSASAPAAAPSLARRAGQAFIAHGEYANAFVELYYFSRRRWARVFARNDWTVLRAWGGGIYYSGYRILPLSMNVRRGLSRILGSSTNIFVLRPR
jgi:SAM-dependent methyltransferase